jgi:hypothetical protein
MSTGVVRSAIQLVHKASRLGKDCIPRAVLASVATSNQDFRMACRLAKTNGIAVVRYDGHQLQFAGINGELANFTIIKEGALIDD